MTMAAQPSVGASSASSKWDAIDWRRAEREVRRLQMRIAKATRDCSRLTGPRLAFERLERCDGKLSCTVLRGVRRSNVSCLPGVIRGHCH